MNTRKLFLPVLLIALCSFIKIKEVQLINTDFMNRITGNWYSNGISFGSPADITMNWTPVLDNKFIHLTYKIVMHPAGQNDRVFEGTA